MKKKKTKFIIIFIIVIFLGGGVFLAYFLTHGKNPIANIINIINNEQKVNDNYNGIYVYKESLNGAKFIYTGCSISEISYYVLVVNDDFYSFKSSCMGTYPIEEGKTEKLEINENEENTSYVLNYNDHEYKKDDTIKEIQTNNEIANRLKEIDVANYELILNETEFEGNYYKIAATIKNLSSNLLFGFDRLDNGTYDISIFKANRNNTAIYKINKTDYNNLPVFYTFGKTLVVIEKDEALGKLKYNFKAMNEDGIIYDLSNKLPIIVNGVSLTGDNSIFVKYDASNRDFILLIGNNDKMCVENSNSNNIAYYEFRIKYDYANASFKMPEFVKFGLENEGCNYTNKIIGG